MRIAATIKPNTKHRNEVVKNTDGSIAVFTKEPAIEGKANEAAARLLADYYGVSKSRVRLVHGHSSKQKVFEITI